MSAIANTSTYLADAGAPIVNLSAKAHFAELSATEQLYAHYMSKASHWGTRAVLRSVSPESNDIYDLILAIHRAVDGKYADSIAAKQYLEYAAQFLSNLGNYKSFGDVKYIPRLSPEEFQSFIDGIADADISARFAKVRTALYSLTQENVLLGWTDKGHVSSYYPGQAITQTEIETVNRLLADQGIMPENTRVSKTAANAFTVHVASADTVSLYKDIEAKGITITFQFGDHASEFAQIAAALTEAAKHAANDTQKAMVTAYVESFKTGSMAAHKESQVQWVKDLGPQVETNIGFIETYRDPSGVRGEWEGLVAMVNKQRTAKFTALVENAGRYIAALPWDKAYEKDTFTPPDFTSLEVMTFAGSGIPAGINIPNYDDVRLNYGFKNVSLGNILSAKTSSIEKITFVDDSLQAEFKKYSDESFEVQVGIHELLGHGSGKLLQETAPGVFNFDKAVVDPATWYKPGETWGSVFGSTSGAFEECRAESVAMYLITNHSLLTVFGITDEAEQKKIIHVGFLLMARAGLCALQFWDPKSGKWGQPHMQARYAILRVFVQAGFVQLETKEADFSDLMIRLDESKIETVGHEAVGEFLRKLHTYKATADVVEGVKFFTGMTDVKAHGMDKYRDAVLNKRLPRKLFIQGNTFVEDGKVELREYEETEVGMIQSFAERET
ncbi:hypothetical protein BABINDRAFT_170679 [Babjeviella inositovora NRRL Y-12698]|uniref:Dipeptidyl peptidase 3 n=1 Tax=Babjeviella inositovora NRRL Y-12698 TaxID=984486 RepID=A0A1E3QTB8_9ASCO|nr:uncharacterized protein BABINDRAFT_170679 [Babjeviella inositovora NRRL Y-12698]ODQ80920.1 hypothetical protein BABINDRAFT_170679 [Babjeviella inositovora NRRL Y-12698]